MSCNACQTSFSFFTRENGCPNCGFSYCSKCLKYKCQLSDGNVKKVCGPCHNKLMSSKKDNSSEPSGSGFLPNEVPHQKPLAPVDIEKKLNALENPAKPPIVIYKQPRWDKLKSGLDPEDQAIVDRLRKLKDEDKQPPPPTTDEIRRRLAQLKDQDPDRNVPVNIHQVDTRSDQEKTNDLIQQYLERLELSKDDPAQDIEKRLNSLRGRDPSKSSSEVVENDENDEETAVSKIIKRAMDEADLESKYGGVDVEDMEIEEVPRESSDEEFSCCMCDQTKDLLKCTGCSGDVYCLMCFEDNHDDFELKKHRTVPFGEKNTSLQ